MKIFYNPQRFAVVFLHLKNMETFSNLLLNKQFQWVWNLFVKKY